MYVFRTLSICLAVTLFAGCVPDALQPGDWGYWEARTAEHFNGPECDAYIDVLVSEPIALGGDLTPEADGTIEIVGQVHEVDVLQSNSDEFGSLRLEAPIQIDVDGEPFEINDRISISPSPRRMTLRAGQIGETEDDWCNIVFRPVD